MVAESSTRYLTESLKALVSPGVLAGVCGVYLALCYAGKQWMTDKKPFNMGKFPVGYNLFQVILSIYMTWGIFGPNGLERPYFFGINNPFTPHLEYYVWVHYWSKMVDFIDTLMIILKKSDRQLNFLHVYHHASIVVIWGLLLWCDVGNGTTAFGAGMNSAIHAIMYTHYLISSLQLNNPFKKYITTAQLIQFGLCIGHSLGVSVFETTTVHPWWIVQFFYQISMMYLFLQFYSRTYNTETPKSTNDDSSHSNKATSSDSTSNPGGEAKASRKKRI